MHKKLAAAMGAYALGPSVTASVAFSLDHVAGGTMPANALDARSLTVTLGWVK